jgi:hypothetical protein
MPTTDRNPLDDEDRRMLNASEENPNYYVSPSKSMKSDATQTDLCMVVCDEGWRQTVVGYDMYRWAADWLVEMIQGIPYAKGFRP